MMKWTYERWVSEQTGRVRAAVNRLACAGIYDEAVYVLPSSGATEGSLIVSTAPQELDVLRFGHHGTRVSAIPSTELRAFIWEACRRVPIVPTTLAAGDWEAESPLARVMWRGTEISGTVVGSNRAVPVRLLVDWDDGECDWVSPHEVSNA
jgi:hypothetical protein